MEIKKGIINLQIYFKADFLGEKDLQRLRQLSQNNSNYKYDQAENRLSIFEGWFEVQTGIKKILFYVISFPEIFQKTAKICVHSQAIEKICRYQGEKLWPK